jgi:hypothetical protein
MKEFYTQCLKDLYALTGIEQVRWMQNDLKDGKRNFELCVAGMVEQSKAFPYIPIEAQQKIILKMIIEDKDYQMLNSRTVFRWLNLHRDAYFINANAPEETPRVQLTEEEEKTVNALIEQWKKDVSKIGSGGRNTQPGTYQIKDQRIQKLKEKFRGKECQHTGPRIEISETEELCNDCGKGFTKQQTI